RCSPHPARRGTAPTWWARGGGGSSPPPWMTYPIPRRSRKGGTAPVPCPATTTCPALGSIRRLISFSVVVFPEPLRPSSTSVSPAATVNDTSRTMGRGGILPSWQLTPPTPPTPPPILPPPPPPAAP